MNSFAAPKQIGSLALVLAALLVGAALPATAAAAPEEGSGLLEASPDPLTLPTTTVGYQSSNQTVSLGYEGEGEVWIEKLTIEGAESGEFMYNGSNCTSPLGNGASCQAWIALKPTSAGDKQATLVVDYSGARPDDSFAIGGRGAAPSLGLSPSSYDFGLHRINRESSSTSIQLTNTGEAGLQPNGFDVQGDSEAFWVDNGACWTWLEPGQSCWLQVWFNPHARVDYQAEVRAWVNGTPFAATVEGRGGAPVVEALENPVDFGGATVGGSGPVKTVTLHNSGDLPEFFFIGVIAGGDAASFKLLDESCTLVELAPGDSCSAHVRFTPDSAGPKAARLAFFGDGEGGMLVQVEGEGIAPAATLLPPSFDFGALAPGSRSPAHEFTLRNDGAAPFAVDRVAIAGADVDQFALSGDECSGAALAPGEQCAVRVRFAPDSAGAKHATLRLIGPSGTLTAALAGAGAAQLQPAGGDPDPPRPARRADRRARFVRGETLDARHARFLHRKGKRSAAHRAARRAAG